MSGKIEEFWEEYEKYIQENSIEDRKNDYLIKDGLEPSHVHQYFKSEKGIKVLFVLKESDEKDVNQDDRTDRTVFHWFGLYKEKKTNDNQKKNTNDHMLTKMIRMHEYIAHVNACNKREENLKNVESKVDFIKKIQTNKEDVYKFAFININKRGHGTDRSDDEEIRKILAVDGPMLRKQVEYLEPNVVVIGGKQIAEDVEDEIIKKACLKNRPILIRVKHFSRMGYKEFVVECEKNFGTIESTQNLSY